MSPTVPKLLVLPFWSKLRGSSSVLSLNNISLLDKSFCLAFAIVHRTRTVPKAFFSSFQSHRLAINTLLYNFPLSESDKFLSEGQGCCSASHSHKSRLLRCHGADWLHVIKTTPSAGFKHRWSNAMQSLHEVLCKAGRIHQSLISAYGFIQ